MHYYYALLFVGMLGISAINAQTCTGNLLTNPGFESGLGDWNTEGTVTTDAGSYSGTKAVKICGSNSRVFQTKSAVAGKNYTLKALCKEASPTESVAGLYIKFMSSSWQPIINSYLEITSGAYSEATYTLTAPNGTAWIEVSLRINSGTGCLFGDDVCLTEATSGGGGGGGITGIDLVPIGEMTIATATNGQRLTYQASFKNQGTVAAVDCTFKVFRSTDAVLDAGDYPEMYPAAVTLAPGESFTLSMGDYLVAPYETVPSTIYYFVVADPDNTIAESNETNNQKMLSGTVTITQPSSCKTDLGVGEIICSRTNGANTEAWSYNNGQTTKHTFDAGGNLISSAPQGVLVFDSTLVTGTTVKRKTVAGVIDFQKTIKQSVLNVIPAPKAALVMPNGEVIIAGYVRTPANPGPPIPGVNTQNKLVIVKANNNLDLIASVIADSSYHNNPYHIFSDRVLGIYANTTGGFTIVFTVSSTDISDYSNTLVYTYTSGLAKTGKQFSYYKEKAYSVIRTPLNTLRIKNQVKNEGLGGYTYADKILLFDYQATGGNKLISSMFYGYGQYDYSTYWFRMNFSASPADSLESNHIYSPYLDPYPNLTFTMPSAPSVSLTPIPYHHAQRTAGNKVIIFAKNNGQLYAHMPGCSPVIGSQPDLQLANLNIPNLSVAAGQVLSYKFDLKNTGAANATGDFKIRSYISTDNILSTNDIQDGTITTGNINAGATIAQVNGASTIPASLAAGQYYLILKVDADGQIAESNETNNTLVSVSKFTVTTSGGGGGSTGTDLMLTMTASPINPGIWNYSTLTLTIKNNGTVAASGVVVNFVDQSNPAISAVFAYASSTAPAGTSFNNWTGKWTVGNLAAGQSVSMTYKGFTKVSTAISIFSQVSAQSPTDIDSAPNNNTTGIPAEDDEARVVLNGSSAFVAGDDRQLGSAELPVILPDFTLFPNPATSVVSLQFGADAGPTTMRIMDNDGKTLISKIFNQPAEGTEQLDISALPSGVYVVSIMTDGQRPVVKKLAVIQPE